MEEMPFPHETDDEEDKDMKQKLLISRIEDISESDLEDDLFLQNSIYYSRCEHCRDAESC
jgi:hypothetical protein